MQTGPRQPIVLVVDDDSDTRELYHMMLESAGCRVVSAGSVRTAAAIAAHTPPSVIITDWRLPDGNGFSVADAVREAHPARHVPIIAITGLNLEPEVVADARRRGFTAILVKPVLPDEILRTIHAAIEIGTARRVRAAAERLRRYAAQAVRHQSAGTASAPIDAVSLVERAAARSGAGIALMLADDRAQYIAAGGGTRELTGYEPKELLSLSVWDLAPPPGGVTGQGLWTSFIASGSQEGRYTLRRRDGASMEAQYCAIANIAPGVHVSALAEASRIASF